MPLIIERFAYSVDQARQISALRVRRCVSPERIANHVECAFLPLIGRQHLHEVPCSFAFPLCVLDLLPVPIDRKLTETEDFQRRQHLRLAVRVEQRRAEISVDAAGQRLAEECCKIRWGEQIVMAKSPLLSPAQPSLEELPSLLVFLFLQVQLSQSQEDVRLLLRGIALLEDPASVEKLSFAPGNPAAPHVDGTAYGERHGIEQPAAGAGSYREGIFGLGLGAVEFALVQVIDGK